MPQNPNDMVCTMDMSLLSEAQMAEIETILNTAVTNGRFVMAALTPEQRARLQAILATAAVLRPRQ